jgi:fibronectin type 3 domain-containing protein
VSTYLCMTQFGDDLLTEISHAIEDCELAVIMGSETFGEKTDGYFSTLDELKAIKSEEKPIFLIKMCERFRYAETRYCFPKSFLYFLWQPHTNMPNDLVDSILDKIAFPHRKA